MTASIFAEFRAWRLAVLWWAAPSLLQAQTAVTTESFGYTTGGTIGGGHGGTGWSQAWQGGDIRLGSGSLVFPTREGGGLAGVATGNRLDYAAAAGAQDFSTRQMASAINFAQGGVWYASVLLRKSVDGGSGGGTDQIAVKFLDTSLSLQRWGFGLGSDDVFYVECGPDNSAWTDSLGGVALNTTYFLVSKLVTSASGNDQWFLNVYGPSDSVPASEPTSWQMSFTGASDAAGIDVVRMEFGTNATGAIDEFRLGSTWTSVTTAVPEPSTYTALAGLAALGLALWRRRRERRLKSAPGGPKRPFVEGPSRQNQPL